MARLESIDLESLQPEELQEVTPPLTCRLSDLAQLEAIHLHGLKKLSELKHSVLQRKLDELAKRNRDLGFLPPLPSFPCYLDLLIESRGSRPVQNLH